MQINDQLITIGSHLLYKDRNWRIVRIVNKSTTLFEPVGHEPYVMIEAYAELKAINGDVDHIKEESKKVPYVGPSSNIRALEPIIALEREYNDAKSFSSGS